MICFTNNTTQTAARLARLTVGVLVAAGVLAVTATGGVDARPRTESEVVAAEADRALESLASWHIKQNPADYVRFVQARESAAELTAVELEVDADQLSLEWATISSEKQLTVLSALTQLGVPYRRLESQPEVGFDCSGLTIWAFEQAGVEIPRNSRDQFGAATEIDHDQAEAGDLVYYPGHIAIYLGGDAMVHSPNSGSNVLAVTLPPKKSLRYGEVVTTEKQAGALSGVDPLATVVVNGATPISQ